MQRDRHGTLARSSTPNANEMLIKAAGAPSRPSAKSIILKLAHFLDVSAQSLWVSAEINGSNKYRLMQLDDFELTTVALLNSNKLNNLKLRKLYRRHLIEKQNGS